MEPTTA